MIARIGMVIALALALGGCIRIGMGPQPIREVVVEASPRWFETDRIAIVEIDGFISAGSTPWYRPGGASVADVRERLNRAAADWRVRAVVLRINSPGGEVSASDILYDEVTRFRRETGVPVVAACVGLATSGGYYVALGADRIYATPTTITGSVGVLMQFMNMEGLFGKIGLQPEVIKTGEKKDIGSPSRPMTDAERALLREISESFFRRFMALVRANRPAMTDEDAAMIADGRVLTADQALALHMIDGIGYMDDILAEARRLAGVETADVIIYRSGFDANANVYAQWLRGAGALGEGLQALTRREGPAFLYLWEPAP